MQKRDRRRWAVADTDSDDLLTKDEFASFLHPEETGHMRDVVVLETMEDIDKDKDGKISLQEYIGEYLCWIVLTLYSKFLFTERLKTFKKCMLG